ncbi:MAG: restriction endonuclease subunit S, partial [Dolichospermum sp.]
RINSELENLAKTIYDYWFVQFDFPDENGKPYKSSGGKMVYNQELKREIPAGWEVVKISKLIDVTDGTHDSPKPSNKGFHLITSKHLSKRGIDFNSAYLISEYDYININKRSQVEQNDILISMIGTIGETYFVKESTINFAIKNIGLLKTSQSSELAELIYLYINSHYGKQYFTSNICGSIQNYLTLGILRKISLIIPKDTILISFNSTVKPIYSKIHLNNQENQQLTQL